MDREENMQDQIGITEEIQEQNKFIVQFTREMAKVIVGQKAMVEKLIIGMLTGGHILLEGVPGLAKTLSIKTLSQIIDAKFQRIQFTPDLLPADLLGTLIYNQKSGSFSVRKGPIFCDILLADEINRAPGKVQSALLECMQERQVTIGKKTHPLSSIFWVLATENPIEHEGTYNLPEAQVDRFMLKVKIEYPNSNEEKEIIQRALLEDRVDLEPSIDLEKLSYFRSLLKRVYLDEKLLEYITRIVFATRKPKDFGLEARWIHLGASPRASIYLALCARATAFLRGRSYVLPEDVKEIAYEVLRHRIILSYEALAEDIQTEDILKQIFEVLPIY